MSTTKPELVRIYGFSDGTLEQLSDLTYSNVERDLIPLAPRGITTGTLTGLETLHDDFINTPTDEESKGLVSEAVEVKNTSRDTVLLDARRLRTAAQNKLGESSAKYKRFVFDGMDKLADVDLPRALRRMRRVGLANTAALASEGIDAAFFTAFALTISAFDDELENVKEAEEARDLQTEQRITKGNALYKEIVRLCNIGKDFFAPVSEALYNDYVIERFLAAALSTAGYDTQTLTVPANGSIIFALADGTGIPADLDVYFRSDGNLKICTTNLPASPCGPISFELEANTTFKGLFSTLGLNMSNTHIQFTNNSPDDVHIVAGGKTA